MSDPGSVEAEVSTRLRRAFDRHYRHLIALGVVLAANQQEAEDIVQDAFVRVAPRIISLREAEERPYLRAIVINIWRNRLRRRAVEVRHGFPRAPAEIELPVEERDAVWRAVAGLAPRQRACIVLRYYEGLSEGEISGLLGCSSSTVRSQISRALRRLRRELSDED